MTEFQWKKFTNTGSKLGNYSISLSNSFAFGLNAGFYCKENIRNFKKVVLFFSKDNNSVGFQFTNDEKADGAFSVIHGKNSGAVSCRSFFLENEVKPELYKGKKIPEKITDKEYGMLYVINLSDK